MKKLALLFIALATGCANASELILKPENTITFRGIVTPRSMAELQKSILKMDAERKDKKQPIYLVLDSPGGSVDAGMHFIKAIAPHVENLQTVSLFAASMAAAIVEGLPGKRILAEGGTLMFHRAAGGIEGQMETGELESRLQYYKSVVRSMEQKNADRMNMSLRLYKDLVKDEMWLFNREALSRSAVDEVASVKCSPELIKKRVKSYITVIFFLIEIEGSACPLIDDWEIAGKADDTIRQTVEKYRAKYRTSGVLSL